MKNSLVKCEVPALFVRSGDVDFIAATPQQVLEAALQMLSQYVLPGTLLSSPTIARDFAQLKLHGLEHEVFAVFLLDVQRRILDYVELFRGSFDGCVVYPREVVKLALSKNAAAVILVHNHPSGSTKPSQADRRITEQLRSALALVDVTVLDHLIVGTGEVLSFAEEDLI